MPKETLANWCEVRYPYTCRCGRQIKIGDRGFYFHGNHTMLCAKCGEQIEREHQEAISRTADRR